MGEANRGKNIKRQWGVLLSLKRGATVTALAAEHGCDERTIRRDLKVLESVGFPVYNEDEEDDKRAYGGVWRLTDRRIL